MEVIGGVRIDDSKYAGRDLYSDGSVEDRLLELVESKPDIRFSELPMELRDWPALYHLSPLRENIISWIPITRMDKVLEVGSGCGAITGALSNKAGEVTCVELSRKRSLINACRHQDRENIIIHLGNYEDIEPELPYDYDYIFLIGVLEYAGSYLNTANPYLSMIASLKKHLSPLGRLVIAIENRLGLKYFAGNREDHEGGYFTGIENYQVKTPAVTFSRRRLEELCRGAGFQHSAFYYPYPDYKFMQTLYSDERLPRQGELTDNFRNFDNDRVYLFNEKNAFDGIIRDGLFPIFSNSFLVVAGPSLPIVYERYSNERADKFAIRTEIRHPTDGVSGSALAALLRDNGTRPEESYNKDKLEVRKIPISPESAPHVVAMLGTYEKLVSTYPGNGLIITPVTIEEDQAVFPYLKGKTLEEVLDHCLDSNNTESFVQFFEFYYRLLTTVSPGEIANYDFIFSNIIITEDNRWNLIDYEWMPPKKATMDELAARALYCYGIGSEKRREIAHMLLARKFGCSEEEIVKLAGREERFQRFVTGGENPISVFRDLINMPIIPVMDGVGAYMENRELNRIQIYEDYGDGFSEEHSYFVPEFFKEKQPVTIDIELNPELRNLRIDPALDYCLLFIRNIVIDDYNVPFSEIEGRMDSNGILLGNGLVLFSTADPYIVFMGIDEFCESLIERDRDMDEAQGKKHHRRGREQSRERDGLIMSVELEVVRISADMGLASADIGVDDDEDEGPGLIGNLQNIIGRFKK